MTNAEFREKFEKYMTGTTEEKIENVTKIIREQTSGLPKKTILDYNDFYNLGKSKLEDIISDVIYKSPNGSILIVNDRLDAYKYMDGWIDIGYLYNIAKGAMTIQNIFGSASCRDYYRELKYLLDRSKLQTIEILNGVDD